MFLASEKKESNPFAAMFGGGKPKTPDAVTRLYGLGGILSGRFANGGRLRIFSQLDTGNMAKSSLLYDPWGNGRLTLLGQLVSTRVAKGTDVDYGLSARLAGTDYTAQARVATGPEFGLSYLQRLAPGSPVTLGGEVRCRVWLLQKSACAWPRALLRRLICALLYGLADVLFEPGICCDQAGSTSYIPSSDRVGIWCGF